MKRKFTAFLLAALLVLVLVPSAVFADTAVTYAESHYKITTTDHTGITDSANSLDITKAGTYTIEMEAGCESSDAQLYVEIGDTEEITLILNGITINANNAYRNDNVGSDNYGIYIYEAGTANVQIKGTNTFKKDGIEYDYENGIYATCSLNITGTGSLDILDATRTGIYADGDLSIKGATITFKNVGCDPENPRDAIEAENGITIENSKITVDGCGDDGIVATDAITISNSKIYINDTDSDGIIASGDIVISRSTVNVNGTENDGIDANDNITISGSTIDIKNIGDNGFEISEDIDISGSTINIENIEGDGIDAADTITILNSKIYINGTDGDGIDTSGDIVISGSTVDVNGIDNDGIDASGDIVISGSTIDVNGTDSNGIYANYNITISGSTIDINDTGDDGIDADNGNIDIEKSTITVNNCDWDGIGADGHIDISGSYIDVKNVAYNGIWAYDDITISGRSDIAINGAPLGAIVGRTIVLEDNLLVLEPTDAHLVDFVWYGDACQTYVHAGESIVFDEYDEPTNAIGTIKIGKSMSSTIMQLMEWVREFAQKLAVLFNYFNTREVITF